jgi:SAM-dependent methyltransferase
VITPDRERDFYDGQYAQFLTLPDHALRIDRRILQGNIDNPLHPFYERRLLYAATMQALDNERPAGKHILDYGCGPADFGLWLSTEGATVTVLDLSPAAIELALKRARASGTCVRGIAVHAGRLDMLRDAEFDVVFACAALHHTMKYPGAVAELARVMKPGARLVLCETWGGNPLLNAVRKLRARIAGEAEDQGEGIILSRHALKSLDSFFFDVRITPLNLLAMGKRILRGRFEQSWARLAVHTLELVDSALLAIAPPLKNWCGEAVITARRRTPDLL